jgi:hypothetical protein
MTDDQPTATPAALDSQPAAEVPTAAPDAEEEPMGFVCEIPGCGRVFDTFRSLRCHGLTHEIGHNLRKCARCSEMVSSRWFKHHAVRCKFRPPSISQAADAAIKAAAGHVDVADAMATIASAEPGPQADAPPLGSSVVEPPTAPVEAGPPTTARLDALVVAAKPVFTCEYAGCGKTFATSRSCKVHTSSHGKWTLCAMCGVNQLRKNFQVHVQACAERLGGPKIKRSRAIAAERTVAYRLRTAAADNLTDEDVSSIRETLSVAAKINEEVFPALMREYRRFLALKVFYGDITATKMAPCKSVAKIWWIQVTDTKRYESTLRRTASALGRDYVFIHHDVNDATSATYRKRQADALMYYRNGFGEWPPRLIWHDAYVCASDIGDAALGDLMPASYAAKQMQRTQSQANQEQPPAKRTRSDTAMVVAIDPEPMPV